MKISNLFMSIFTITLATFMILITFLFVKANFMIAGDLAIVTFVLGGFFFSMIRSLANEMFDKGMEVKNIKTSYGKFPTIFHLERYLENKYKKENKK